MTTVRPTMRRRTADRTASSVRPSRFAVGSSRRSSGASRRKARAGPPAGALLPTTRLHRYPAWSRVPRADERRHRQARRGRWRTERRGPWRRIGRGARCRRWTGRRGGVAGPRPPGPSTASGSRSARSIPSTVIDPHRGGDEAEQNAEQAGLTTAAGTGDRPAPHRARRSKRGRGAPGASGPGR